MSDSGFFKPGDWNFICDQCGFTFKASRSRLSTSPGGGPPVLRVCRRCWDVRNPQEFLRPIADPRVIPWSRPIPPNIFIDTASTEAPRLMDASLMDTMTMD